MTRPPCLSAARSVATRSRMKFEECEDSDVLMKSCVNGSAWSWFQAKSRMEFYHRGANWRNGKWLGRRFCGGVG